ncbi:hypothetical protein C8A01DRAFT_47136 [Parachaetomium inaequale]|uniref:Glutathione S-transferase n=1 Tax=Parachaetomium inaequale TaxID=2588326 RepID=A0AAN6PEG2_9PEZI|nr:hypothetical protein C8A01DRAFT_47136 [Parachaetomium inaequale]
MASQETAPQPKITLYWLNESRAQRLAWLFEELGLEYDVKIFHRDSDMRAPPALEKLHPLGKAPIVGIALPDPADPSKQKQLVLAESGFIAQYLTEHFGRTTSLSPKRYRDGQEGQLGGETDEWMRYQYFLHYAEGSLMPPILVGLILSILKSPKIPFFIRPITSSVVDKMFAAFLAPEMAKHMAFLESQLESSPGNGGYLCGAYLTAADILMSFPLQLACERVGGLSAGKGKGKIADEFPKLWAYLKRLEQEPGYQRAEAKIKEFEQKN